MSFHLRIILLAAVTLLAACGKEPLYQEQGYVFGTLVEVSVYGEEEMKARQAVATVMQEFQRLHNLLHAWKPSELSELNAAFAQGKSKPVSPELEFILQDAARLSMQSEGLFNPAIGDLIKLWGFQADEFKAALPDEQEIARVVAANPQMSDITLTPGESKKAGQFVAFPSGGRVELMGSKNRAVRLDLGGYAKGYALDRAAELLQNMGVHNALVNIGGNVMALGAHGSRAWRVGIQHPRQPGPLAMLELHDGEAIGTSGDYQRYFELNGVRYCHLLDPRTGSPVQGVQAVTILTHGAHAGGASDAASKPLFVSGQTGWRKAAKQMGLEEALLIDDAGVVHITPAMQKRLEFVDKQTTVKVE